MNTCETCRQPVKRYEAVQRGDGHRIRYFHRGDCFELDGIQAATQTDVIDRYLARASR